MFQAARSWTPSALSGRQVGNSLVVGARVARVPLVRLEIVDRIVGAAHHDHAVLLEQALRGEVVLGQAAVAVVVDLARGVGTEELVLHAERKLQLEMRPVIERVAERVGDRAGPGLELVPVGRVAGDQALGHAVGAHRAPFVVIALEPDLGQRLEPVIVGDLVGRQVAVIVDDRLRPRELFVEIDRDRRIEQEIVVEKPLHGRVRPSLRLDLSLH